jgi:hypothetical protein
MFCSDQCLKEAEENFHGLECLIFQQQHVDELKAEIVFGTIRFLLESTKKVKKIDDLRRFLDGSSSKKTIFDFDFEKLGEEDILTIYNGLMSDGVKLSRGHFAASKQIVQLIAQILRPNLSESDFSLLVVYCLKIMKTNLNNDVGYDSEGRQFLIILAIQILKG